MATTLRLVATSSRPLIPVVSTNAKKQFGLPRILLSWSADYRLILLGIFGITCLAQYGIYQVPDYLQDLWNTMQGAGILKHQLDSILNQQIFLDLIIYLVLSSLDPFLYPFIQRTYVGFLLGDRLRMDLRARCAVHIRRRRHRITKPLPDDGYTVVLGSQFMAEILAMLAVDTVRFVRGSVWIVSLWMLLPWEYAAGFVAGALTVNALMGAFNWWLRKNSRTRQVLEARSVQATILAVTQPGQLDAVQFAGLIKQQRRIGSLVGGAQESGYSVANWLLQSLIGGAVIVIAFHNGLIHDGLLIKLIALMPQAATPFVLINEQVLTNVFMKGAFLRRTIQLVNEAGADLCFTVKLLKRLEKRATGVAK